jgi:class 3 adenylate cyclase/pimeloyl-ACP methyl ester carboxylesterase
MEAPRIQYAKSVDGTAIACTVLGSGPPLVVATAPLSAGLNTSLRSRERTDFWLALSARRTLVLFDQRHSGLSGPATAFSFELMTADIASVADQLGLERFDLWGFMSSCHVTLRFAAEYSERVGRLILTGPTPKGVSPRTTNIHPDLYQMAEIDWFAFTSLLGLANQGWTDSGREYAEDLRRLWTPESFAALMSAIEGFDSWPFAPSVSCPTLILTVETPRRNHPVADRPASARRLASLLPNARLVIPPPLGLQGTYDPRQVELVETFLGEDLPAGKYKTPRSPEDTLPEGAVVILFTDIVESTALTERLGDAAFRSQARELDASLRVLVREAGGTPVEGTLLGDGLLAVFTSARQAIDCALRCNAAAESAGLQLHLGLHAGDVLREGNNVYGGAVNIAARIMALTEPGQVLVSDTVRSLARTSAGVTFADQGEHALKGIADPVRVFEVRGKE